MQVYQGGEYATDSSGLREGQAPVEESILAADAVAAQEMGPASASYEQPSAGGSGAARQRRLQQPQQLMQVGPDAAIAASQHCHHEIACAPYISQRLRACAAVALSCACCVRGPVFFVQGMHPWVTLHALPRTAHVLCRLAPVDGRAPFGAAAGGQLLPGGNLLLTLAHAQP